MAYKRERPAFGLVYDTNACWGSWWIGGDGSICICCAECGRQWALDDVDELEVRATGHVYPKMGCPGLCGFSRHVRLLGWRTYGKHKK